MPVFAQVLRRAQLGLKAAAAGAAGEDDEGGEGDGAKGKKPEGKPKAKAKAKGRPKMKAKAKAKGRGKSKKVEDPENYAQETGEISPKENGEEDQVDEEVAKNTERPSEVEPRRGRLKRLQSAACIPNNFLEDDCEEESEQEKVMDEGGQDIGEGMTGKKASQSKETKPEEKEKSDTEVKPKKRAKKETAKPAKAEPGDLPEQTRKRKKTGEEPKVEEGEVQPKRRASRKKKEGEEDKGQEETTGDDKPRKRAAEKESFAKRVEPKGGFNKIKWAALRDVFSKMIMSEVTCLSKHEDFYLEKCMGWCRRLKKKHIILLWVSHFCCVF